MRVMDLWVRWSSMMKIGMHGSQMVCYEGQHGLRCSLRLTAT